MWSSLSRGVGVVGGLWYGLDVEYYRRHEVIAEQFVCYNVTERQQLKRSVFADLCTVRYGISYPE